jgi:hypothetical protein
MLEESCAYLIRELSGKNDPVGILSHRAEGRTVDVGRGIGRGELTVECEKRS